MDLYKDGLRRVQSTDSLGSSPGLQGLGGYNHKAKSASHLDESDFGPLVGADCGAPEGLVGFGDTLLVSSIQLTAGHFLLTKVLNQPFIKLSCIVSVKRLIFLNAVLNNDL